MGAQCTDCVQAGRNQQRTQQAHYRRSGYGARTVAGARLNSSAIVTPVLIGLNVLIFVLTAVQAGSIMAPQYSAVFQEGVLWPVGIVRDGEWWRLLASGFLHYGLLHIAMNMIALWVLGRDLELLLGKIRFVAVYLVSMLGGAASVFVFGDVKTGTAGASGAIFGLMGAIAVAVFRLRLNPRAAIGVIVLNVVLSVTIPQISLLGHLGGLVIGALAMVAMVYAPQKRRSGWQAGVVGLLALALLGLLLVQASTLAGSLGIG